MRVPNHKPTKGLIMKLAPSAIGLLLAVSGFTLMGTAPSSAHVCSQPTRVECQDPPKEMGKTPVPAPVRPDFPPPMTHTQPTPSAAPVSAPKVKKVKKAKKARWVLGR